MRNFILVLIFTTVCHLSVLGQKLYYTGMPEPITCNCTIPVYGNPVQFAGLPFRPLVVKSNCEIHCIHLENQLESFSFFRRKKKMPPVRYPKTSNIIRF